MAFKPHRVRYWLNPSDPEFDEKAERICRIYLRPPAKTTVLSLDEKPGIQVLSRKFPTKPMKAGYPKRIEFEYKRCGTRNLFAAFNIKTGHVLAAVTRGRATWQVLEFLDYILTQYKRGPIIMITDNIHTRRGEPAKQWLKRHPRVSFVFTPFHGSWLNQVEIWFGILTSKCLRTASFASSRALAGAIMRFVRYWNRCLAHPFAWTYTGKILAR